MSGKLEPGALRDCEDPPLDAGIGEGDDLAAAPADQMVVMGAVGLEPLVPRRLGTEVDTLDEPQLLELLQSPVDARPANPLEAAIDLQRGQGAGLAGQQVDDPSPRAAAAVAGSLQGLQRVSRPIAPRSHGRSLSKMRLILINTHAHTTARGVAGRLGNRCGSRSPPDEIRSGSLGRRRRDPAGAQL